MCLHLVATRALRGGLREGGVLVVYASPEVLLSVCHVLPSERACDLAHLRYSLPSL
jgi:hypothetical protein